MNAVGKTVPGGVPAGYVQGCLRDIGRINRSRGKFFGQGHGDTARTRAQVDERDALARGSGSPARPNLTNGEAVERDFDEMLGFGARNQHVRRDFEFEPPEFLLAGEMLRGLARPTALDEGEISLGGGFRESFFGV